VNCVFMTTVFQHAGANSYFVVKDSLSVAFSSVL